jgi:hypothetical protein
MNKHWKTVALGEVLVKSDDWVEIEPTKLYKQVTLRLWEQGATLRNEILGSEINSPKQLKVHTGQFVVSRIDARNGAFGIVSEYLNESVVSNDFPAFNLNLSKIEATNLRRDTSKLNCWHGF